MEKAMKKSFIFIIFLFAIACSSVDKNIKPEVKEEEKQQAKEMRLEEEKQQTINENAKLENTEKKEEIIALKTDKIQTGSLSSVNKKINQAKTEKQQKAVFTMTLFPFFLERGELPYELKEEIDKKIPEIQKILKKYPKAQIYVKGYSSAEGKLQFNTFLSRWRAVETRDYLIYRLKIDTKKFVIQGKGPHSSPNPKNRKVEIFIIP